MEEGKETEKYSITTLPQEQLKQYKEMFLEENVHIYCTIFQEDIVLDMLGKHAAPENAQEKSLGDALSRMIDIFINLLRGISTRKPYKMKMVSTKYRFSTAQAQVQVSADLEALMGVLDVIDISQYPELFRQSASAAEVKVLCNNLQHITFPHISPDIDNCPEEKQKRNREIIRIITYNFKEFEIETVASVYKQVLKSKNPLFPSQYIKQYMEIGKVASTEDKILLSKFLLLFTVSPAKRELLEVTCSFLYSLITKKDSPLRFENISVVFTPIFFIDDKCCIVDANFKEVLEQLRDFLKFFLQNSPAIFLMEPEP
ncbi:uncharacterized protein NEMAJ01_0326 [Nematocida major]|uniref:uncharacterized protein n=1 Tax=Nematocida major TaxID=1912982 RepID=UPI0020081FE1|nr:uncharacterized protein NEMAJ01_0326 [Nematocida major]KAH9385430.1 hypothetical protein NEMAJ01_0326 [Nematocida major]